jgi:hypothetical protein
VTLRTVIWEPPTRDVAGQLPSRVQRLLLALVADLATGPIPPKDVLSDTHIPEAYEIHTSELTVKFTIYDDEVRILVVRSNS